MREILFRGKRIDNGEWVYGDLSHSSDGRPFIAYFDETGEPYYYGVDSKTVGQCTGLKDQYGNKIFEGDILCFADIVYN